MSHVRESLAGRRLHFIGIGGCGMSGLALVARELGAHVTGSDAKKTIYTESLERNGVAGVSIGHDAANVPESPAEVVFSSAVRPENIERAEARRKGLGELHRSALLTEFTALHETIAVGGAHGKSSTAALLAHVLTSCGTDPSYVVGALLRPPGVHAAAGSGGALVIEADESDKSLLNYRVHTAVVTNVDLDHVGDGGGYQDITDVAKVLGEFATNAKAAIVSTQAAAHLRPFVSDMTVVEPELIDGEPMRFRLQGEEYEVNQPGVHQLHNAALVVQVALARECAPADIRAALLAFPGLARRFELRGTTGAGARVYDDYAHHPVEVAAALAAARQVVGAGRVLAVFQPHLFSRTRQFQTEFLDALSTADRVWVEPVYPARENPTEWTYVAEQLAADVTGRAPRMRMSPGRAELARQLLRDATDGDVVMLIGAGDVNALAEDLVR
ncbi:UDP-N-acetylmuramate--L-alanine ligase [Streptomyces antarcticus]|uniref:UDP-N-acetylmuramate--L-alanine ligase n=1 Tax=Streptomyces antarcticus TaxID=2996458 RepID=UPI002271AA07|nr:MULTISPECIES: UDP-N-acetylmuramate--L-alanine ligase [unclassified Streptomyces]MCY0944953.1 UDP-N-acetylmuramate--L-alanine ligase [Streptomyces sp. H34-AA3]MCZ4082125.1 UDP-N-acetylmuramate--L-alanine ligase [Streptomyces sp. H34-S5]